MKYPVLMSIRFQEITNIPECPCGGQMINMGAFKYGCFTCGILLPARNHKGHPVWSVDERHFKQLWLAD